MKKREVAFDFLRIVAIILIIFSHILKFDDPVTGLFIKLLGVIGNGAFFFISGFVIYQNNSKIENGHDIINFYKKRVLRIFPLYWVALIVSILVFAKDYTYNLLFLASHFLGIQMILYPKFISTNIIPFWFIGILLFYYLIYPFLIYYKATTSKKILLYSSIFFAGLVGLKICTGLIGGGVFEYFYIFIAGILFAEMDLFNKISKSRFYNLVYLCPVLILFILYLSAIQNYSLDENMASISLKMILYVISVILLRWIVIFSAILFVYAFYKKYIANSSGATPYIIAGSISSYAVFLFHKPFFYYFDAILNLLSIQNIIAYNFIQIIIGVPLVFLLCHYITKYFDALTKHFASWT